MKWRFLFLFALLIINVFAKSLPMKTLPAIVVSDTSLLKLEIPKFDELEVISDSETKKFESVAAENTRPSNETVLTEDGESIKASKASTYRTRSLLRNVRPGQRVEHYEVKISFDGNTFNGEVVFDVVPATREDSIILHRKDLDVHDVRVGSQSIENAESVDYNDDDDEIIEIFPNDDGNSFVVVIEYSGEISNIRKGISQRDFNG